MVRRQRDRRAYQRAWTAANRAEFFNDKTCACCGSKESLELDHIDPDDRVSNNIWSWSRERRTEELKKCQVLCHTCHVDKTQDQRKREMSHGTRNRYAQGCKCEACKRANTERSRMLRLFK
jgi:5-methylcytosine-specific restriction endonuclease McrA